MPHGSRLAFAHTVASEEHPMTDLRARVLRTLRNASTAQELAEASERVRVLEREGYKSRLRGTARERFYRSLSDAKKDFARHERSYPYWPGRRGVREPTWWVAPDEWHEVCKTGVSDGVYVVSPERLAQGKGSARSGGNPAADVDDHRVCGCASSRCR